MLLFVFMVALVSLSSGIIITALISDVLESYYYERRLKEIENEYDDEFGKVIFTTFRES